MCGFKNLFLDIGNSQSKANMNLGVKKKSILRLPHALPMVLGQEKIIKEKRGRDI